jgi:hypothetical protein
MNPLTCMSSSTSLCKLSKTDFDRAERLSVYFQLGSRPNTCEVSAADLPASVCRWSREPGPPRNAILASNGSILQRFFQITQRYRVSYPCIVCYYHHIPRQKRSTHGFIFILRTSAVFHSSMNSLPAWEGHVLQSLDAKVPRQSQVTVEYFCIIGNIKREELHAVGHYKSVTLLRRWHFDTF